jgi:hypothetical protein
VPSRSEAETARPGATQELVVSSRSRMGCRTVAATLMCTATSIRIMPRFTWHLLIRQTKAVMTNSLTSSLRKVRIRAAEEGRQLVDGLRQRPYTIGSGEPKIAEEKH